MLFQDKTALVTGGAAGIGRDIARKLASEGARVVSMDWSDEANRETAQMIRAAGGDAEAVAGDVSRAADVARAFETAGDVHILVNNAAFSKGDGFLLEVDEEAWDRVVAICLKSVYLCSREALRGMVARRSGVIINISSVNALTGIHLAAYTSAKGAILSLTRLLAAQYGPSGVRVNAICPGTILSQSSREHYVAHPDIAADLRALYPGGNFGTPDDIASAVAFLASDQASFMNGSIMTIDGGLSAVHQIRAVAAGSHREGEQK